MPEEDEQDEVQESGPKHFLGEIGEGCGCLLIAVALVIILESSRIMDLIQTWINKGK